MALNIVIAVLLILDIAISLVIGGVLMARTKPTPVAKPISITVAHSVVHHCHQQNFGRTGS